MLHSLYRIADLTVVPSIYEPFGLVALEAMASGCPCLVADTGGLREVVPRRATSGCASTRATPTRSAAMAERLLTDDALRDRLVAEASEHVLTLRLGRRRPPGRGDLRRAAPRRRLIRACECHRRRHGARRSRGGPARPRQPATDPLAALKASCKVKRSTDRPPRRAAEYRLCTAPVASFDGTSLDATLTLPMRVEPEGDPPSSSATAS